MSVAAQSIMIGFGIIASLFAYFAFKFNQSDSEVMQIVGWVFFALSLVFVNIITFSALQIAENNAATYLVDGAILPATQIVMWVLGIIVCLILLRAIWYLVVNGYGLILQMFGKQRRKPGRV